MGSFILYSYNDMVFSLLKMLGYDKSVVNKMAHLFSFDVETGEYLTEFLLNMFSRYLSMPFSLNILILFSVILTFLFSYLLFLKISKSEVFSVIFSFLFSLSMYFLFRVISFTPALIGVWSFALLTWLLVSKRNLFYVGLVICLIFTISVYYAFFSMVIFSLWFFTDLIIFKQKTNSFKKYVCVLLIPILFTTFIFKNSLVRNIPFAGNYERPVGRWTEQDKVTIYRSIEDWYNLSFRPWYFFIPPKSSIFFGDFSKNLYQKIENTGYYLADDYMEEEMAGSYMGWHFLIGLGVVGTLLLLKKFKNKEYKTFKTVYENKEMIIRSFFIIFCILLISGPPSFTIRGITFYTPTYLLYYIVPVFRTLVRWAVVIYLFVLIINSFLVQDLYNLMKTKLQKTLFILTFLILNFVIFAIKIPVININKPPAEIAFVKEKYPESVPYAVYPKGDYYSIFWIISHEDLLINPVNFINYETGFDSNEFSKKLITKEGIQEFLNMKPQYLIYYSDKISEKDLEKITEINPEIQTKQDIIEFFEDSFGKTSYQKNNVIIFSVSFNAHNEYFK